MRTSTQARPPQGPWDGDIAGALEDHGRLLTQSGTALPFHGRDTHRLGEL